MQDRLRRVPPRISVVSLGVLFLVTIVVMNNVEARNTDLSSPSEKTDATNLMLNDLRLVSYYPSDAGWIDMWINWNPTVINADLERIAGLQANAVRVVVQPMAFGFPKPDQVMMNRLASMIDMASAHHLKVQLTLFDWWEDYQDLDGSKSWIDRVLTSYVDDPRIAFIELQNEVDPADAAAMTWVKAMLPYVQHMTPTIPVTVSTRDPGEIGGAAQQLQGLQSALGDTRPDFFDIHLYGAGEVGGTATTLHKAKELAGTTPLYIGETGRPTRADASAGGQPEQDGLQASFLNSVATATAQVGLPKPGIWILRDFQADAIPAQATHPDEYAYGLFRSDGSEKPAAQVIRAFFASGQTTNVFNSGFEQGTAFPLGWRAMDSGQAVISRDTTQAHTGAASAKISGSGRGDNSVPGLFTVPTAGLTVHSGKSYVASVWMKGQQSTGSNTVAIAWYDADGNYVASDESAAMSAGTTPWPRFQVVGKAPAKAVYAELHVKSGGNKGTVWFDDADLVSAG